MRGLYISQGCFCLVTCVFMIFEPSGPALVHGFVVGLLATLITGLLSRKRPTSVAEPSEIILRAEDNSAPDFEESFHQEKTGGHEDVPAKVSS